MRAKVEIGKRYDWQGHVVGELHVACPNPTCNAEPGKPCKTREGLKMTTFHFLRSKRYHALSRWIVWAERKRK
jgi:hypothetical protein